jgi:hypothetical protein
MRRHARIGAVLLALVAVGWAAGGEPRAACCAAATGCAQQAAAADPGQPCLLDKQKQPAAWFPYGGGLLHWWDPHCFPRCAGPDDYCRKQLPNVCWPGYPPWYVWVRPATCCPNCKAP